MVAAQEVFGGHGLASCRLDNVEHESAIRSCNGEGVAVKECATGR